MTSLLFRNLTFAALAVLSACKHADGESASSAQSLDSTATGELPSSIDAVAGTYAISDGEPACGTRLTITRADDVGVENSLSARATDDAGVGLGMNRIFYGVGGEGFYSFNSSVNEWTYRKASLKDGRLVQKEARSYFIKPLSIFARTRAQITFSPDRIEFKQDMWDSEIHEPRPYVCVYSSAAL